MKQFGLSSTIGLIKTRRSGRLEKVAVVQSGRLGRILRIESLKSLDLVGSKDRPDPASRLVSREDQYVSSAGTSVQSFKPVGSVSVAGSGLVRLDGVGYLSRAKFRVGKPICPEKSFRPVGSGSWKPGHWFAAYTRALQVSVSFLETTHLKWIRQLKPAGRCEVSKKSSFPEK